MKKSRRNTKYLVLLLLLLGITLGYALVSTTLKINGHALFKKHTWDVYWDNPVVSAGSVSNVLPTITEESGEPENTKVVWNVDLPLPGDYYEFTIDAVNNGSLDAMIVGLEPTVSPALPTNPDYIKYEVTYENGGHPVINHLLPKKSGNTPTTEKYKVRVYYDEVAATAESVNDIPQGGTSYTFNLGITYGEASDDAFDTPKSLSTDSWKTIAAEGNIAATQTEVVNGKCGIYNVGDTKSISSKGNFRISNCSTPVECSDNSFSQTACGFVFESTTYIASGPMNISRDYSSTVPGYGNKGGWQHSYARATLNCLVYEAKNISFVNNCAFQGFPTDLKNLMKSTKVVSGYSADAHDTANFVTNDKLYLLAPKEVWGSSSCDYTESRISDSNFTRKLDYYEMNNTNACYSTTSPAGKGNTWWLRSPYVDYGDSYFVVVSPYGVSNLTPAVGSQTYSPAFRLNSPNE